MTNSTHSAEHLPDSPGALAITKAAAKLFAQHGYDQVSMNAIAAAAGVSKANIFHHFESKEGLYQAVLVSACGKTKQLLSELFADEGNYSRQFSQFAAAHLEHLFQETEAARLILRELLEGSGHLTEKLPQQIMQENFQHLVATITQGQTANVLRKNVDPAILATILVGANVFFFLAHELLGQFDQGRFVENPGEYSRALADILLQGCLNPSNTSLRQESIG